MSHVVLCLCRFMHTIPNGLTRWFIHWSWVSLPFPPSILFPSRIYMYRSCSCQSQYALWHNIIELYRAVRGGLSIFFYSFSFSWSHCVIWHSHRIEYRNNGTMREPILEGFYKSRSSEPKLGKFAQTEQHQKDGRRVYLNCVLIHVVPVVQENFQDPHKYLQRINLLSVSLCVSVCHFDYLLCVCVYEFNTFIRQHHFIFSVRCVARILMWLNTFHMQHSVCWRSNDIITVR